MKKLLALLVTAVLAVSLVACGSVKIDGMTLPESQILNKGDSIQLTPAFASEKEKNEDKIAKAAEKLTLEWATSDETVATVDETGLVTAVGAGEADITVKISEREITTVCAITVEIKADGVNAPEAMEFTVTASTRHLGTPLRDLSLKPGILVAVVARGGEIIIPEGSTSIQEGDSVILISRDRRLQDLNDIYDEGEHTFSAPGGMS